MTEENEKLLEEKRELLQKMSEAEEMGSKGMRTASTVQHRYLNESHGHSYLLLFLLKRPFEYICTFFVESGNQVYDWISNRYMYFSLNQKLKYYCQGKLLNE